MTPACPITAAQAALTLLRGGRAAMAQRVLGLPALIEAKLVEARGSGFAEGWDAHLMAPRQWRRGARRALDPLQSAAGL